jgi:hypothetical protein
MSTGHAWKGESDMHKALIALGTLALAGCSPSADIPAAQKAIDAFHHELDAGQFTQIYSGSSGDMKGTTSADNFTKLLAAIHRKLGPFKSGKLIGWNDSTTTNGHFISLNYHANYDKGDAAENFVYRIAAGQPILAGYHINSDALILN